MNNNLTELVFILDMSGSMDHLTDDTIGGFNSVLKEHADKEGKVLVTTYLFNNSGKMIHDRVPIEKVPKLTDKEYRASGCTALLDCMGQAISHISGIHRYARKQDIPAHTVFVITTDGMENASTSYTADEVRKMVEHEQEKYGWEFIFLAANIDAVETAKMYGIRESNAVDYCPSSEGTDAAYGCISMAVGNVRKSIRLDADSSWRDDADAKFKKSRKR